MRWAGQSIAAEQPDALPGLAAVSGLVRSVTTPEFAGLTFHEVLAKSALNHVGGGRMAGAWTINPYRGCSHACNYCFARNSHTYLDLDAGADFDRQIIVKVNVAEVLAKELAKPGWQRHPVALGTNTDPYQRAEGRYRLMPGIIAALAASGTPFSILTKGTLLRRDLPLLAAARERVSVDLAMSIAIFDETLQQQVEPGTPTTKARLATLRAATDAGFRVTAFMMPVLPHLTDSIAHLDRALGELRAAGAASVLYTALHLRPGTKEWFLAWLARDHPALLPKYRELYGDRAYALKQYRQWLADRIKPLLRKHGLARTSPAPGDAQRRADSRPAQSAAPGLDSSTMASGTGAAQQTTVRFGAVNLDRDPDGDALLAEELPTGVARHLLQQLQPTLF